MSCIIRDVQRRRRIHIIKIAPIKKTGARSGFFYIICQCLFSVCNNLWLLCSGFAWLRFSAKWLAFGKVHQEWSGNEDRRVGTGDDPDQHRESETTGYFTTYQEEDEKCQEHRQRRHDRT